MTRWHGFSRGGPLRLLLCLGLSTACDVAPIATSPGGVAPGSDGLVVVTSDYQSVNVALVGWDGATLSESLISSASRAPGLSAALSGDVVAPTSTTHGDELVLLDRYPASVLTWVRLRDGSVRAQLPVGIGFAANPHDYLELSPTRALVTRFEPNELPGIEPFDQGSDVLVVDPSLPRVERRIDLSVALQGEDARFSPRPDRLVKLGNGVVTLLGGYAARFEDAAESRLVRIDPIAERVTEVLVLRGLHGCSGLTVSPDGTELAVSCSGLFAGDSIPTLEDSALVRIGAEPLRELGRVPARAVGESSFGFSLAYVDAERVLVTTFGRLASTGLPAVDDRLLEVDLRGGAARELLRSQRLAFTLGEVRCASTRCFAADADRNALVELRRDDGLLRVDRLLQVETAVGLPPRYLGAFSP